MDDRHTNRRATGLILTLLLSLPTMASPSASGAAVRAPSSAEPRPSARRTAARAIERRSSTQWLSDVAERLRVLEEHAERAARPAETPRGAASPSLLPGRNGR